MLGSLAYIAPLFGAGHTADDRATVDQHGEQVLLAQCGQRDHRSRQSRDIIKGARGEVVSLGFVISLWAGSSAVSAFVDSITEAHDQTPLRHPVRQRFFALGLYMVMLMVAIADCPVGRPRPAEDRASSSPRVGPTCCSTATTPCWCLAWSLSVTVLYRVSLPKPLPSHRLVLGAVLATMVFLVATLGLRIYLTWITSTGYTYGALATPIAFLLFAFFLGFAVMIGAELNTAIQEEWPAPATHANGSAGGSRRRPPNRSMSFNGELGRSGAQPAAAHAQGRRRYFLSCS